MTAFSVTPAQGFTPPENGDFPNYIQFQQDGVNLGLPSVDTVDFSDGLTATRGTGENENKITVTAPTLVVALTGVTPADMDGAVYSDWTGIVWLASVDAEWSEVDQAIKFLKAGVFRVQLTGSCVRSDAGNWPIDETFVGSEVVEDINIPHTVYARYQQNSTGVGEKTPGWTDEFVVEVIADQLVQPKLYARSYSGVGLYTVNFKARLQVQYLGLVAP